MKTEVKIFLESKDTVEIALAVLRETPAARVIFNIPRGSGVGSTKSLQHLKKESEKLEKEFSIESIDTDILSRAHEEHILASHALFKPKSLELNSERAKVPDPEELSDHDDVGSAFPRPNRLRRFTFAIATLFVFAGMGITGYFILTSFLPRATITITLKESLVSFDDSVTVTTQAAIPRVTEEGITLPGELLTARKNIEMRFTASEQKNVEAHAKGTLVIYNAYDSKPQILVERTRFISPDGKVFRLIQQVTVPGASVSQGTIVPSSVSAEVVADVIGPSSNIGPVARWRIPGFVGTPRYEKFYAESVLAMTGGFVGVRFEPSEADVAKARHTIRAALESAVRNELLVVHKDSFKIFEETAIFALTQEDVRVSSDGGAEFSFFAEGEMRQLVFDESMLKTALISRTHGKVPPDKQVRTFTLSYADSRADVRNESLTMRVTGLIGVVARLDPRSFTASISGFTEEQLRGFVFALRDVERARVGLWPFWVRSIPMKADKIQLVVE